MGPLVETVYKGREKTDESVVSFLNKVCEMELEKYIESSYEELATYVNAYDQKMIMKRENIASVVSGQQRKDICLMFGIVKV